MRKVFEVSPFSPVLTDEHRAGIQEARSAIEGAADRLSQGKKRLEEIEQRIADHQARIPALREAAADAQDDAVNALVVCERQIQILSDRGQEQAEAVAKLEKALAVELSTAANKLRRLMPSAYDPELVRFVEQLLPICSWVPVAREFAVKADSHIAFRATFFEAHWATYADPAVGAQDILARLAKYLISGEEEGK